MHVFRQPLVILVAGALIISFSGVFVKISQVHPTVSAFYRVFIGCIFLSLACWIKGEFRTRGAKDNALALVCGLVFGLDLLCWHLSIQYVGPGLATVLGNCQVFILALAGWLFFKEKLGIFFALSLPLAFAGLFMVIGLDRAELSREYLIGVGFGVLTAVFYGGFLLLLRYIQSEKADPDKGRSRNRKGGSIFYYQVVVTASCSVFLAGVIFATGQSFGIPSSSSFFSLLGLGGLSQALAWAMIANALPRVEASRAGLVLLLQPALSFVWDVAFFQRLTGVMGWAGVAMVLGAIYLGMIDRKNNA